jgi:hypothetical protein
MISFNGNAGKLAETEKMLGLSEMKGWTRTSKQTTDSATDERTTTSSIVSQDVKYTVQYTKTFPTTEAINAEFGQYSDTTLQVTSTFEKQFRWFYTYLYYSETYHPINKMDMPIDLYITSEDSAFVERLPAEGRKITPADSLQFTMLHDKLFDKYGTAAIMDEYIRIVLDIMRSQNTETRWQDTLATHKAALFEALVNENSREADVLLDHMDSLGIPLDYNVARREFRAKSKHVESKVSFIAWASEGTFKNSIAMPWDVVSSNADSVSGNRLFFNPPVIKFTFKEYKLHATSRKMNYWAVIVSIAMIGLTIVLFVRKSNMKNRYSH